MELLSDFSTVSPEERPADQGEFKVCLVFLGFGPDRALDGNEEVEEQFFYYSSLYGEENVRLSYLIYNNEPPQLALFIRESADTKE